jgi:two-component system, NtrC family, sensor histidine kinase PilS
MQLQRIEIVDEVQRRRDRVTLALLHVYNAYRVVLGIALLGVYLQGVFDSRLGSVAPDLYFRIAAIYCVLNLASLAAGPLLAGTRMSFVQLATGIVVVDIFMLTVLMYASGGVASGLGVLILVSVAAQAILVAGRRATLAPALATLAVLYEEFYLALSAPQLHDDYFQAGVLGALYFTASLAIQYLSRRIRDKDIETLTQASELADLEQLNRQIIQRMRTGIAVVDARDRLRMLNESARTLLGVPAGATPVALPEAIHSYLRGWRNDVELRALPFQIGPETPEVRANFSPIRPDEPAGDVIIFLEDAAELQQHALQLKLAALGRLSASIAHEIRNPLSAISHAAQLLHESPGLVDADRRLSEIIQNHCQRMNGVIENVLKTSRRHTPTPVRFALADELARVIAAFREATPEAAIEVVIEPPRMQVRMDKSQLEQVLINLMTNAVRHSEIRSGRPWVRLEAGIEPRTERPYLNVLDEGPGVEAAQRDKLFEPFFSTVQSGTGLGLYLSRELCEGNQARLTYHAMESGGACFRITFAHPDRVIA